MKNTVIFSIVFLCGTVLGSCFGGGSGANASAAATAETENKTEASAAAVEQEPVETGIIATALPIVYQLADGTTKVLPHLDLSIKKYVIGIWSGGMCVALRQFHGDWDGAMNKNGSKSRQYGSEWELPARGTDTGKLREEIEKFNNTVVTLKEDKIDADPWDTSMQGGYYWTKTTSGTNGAYYFGMQGIYGAGGTREKDGAAKVRYVRKDVKR